MRLTRLLHAAALGAALSTAVTSPARAQQGDPAIATELFNAGRDLMKDGDYAAACPKLSESARLDPKVGTLAKLAECEEKVGHLAVARGRWQQALNLARTSGDERAALVEGELARIDKVVPKLSVGVTGPPPAGFGVRVDDLEVGAGSLGVPLPVDPGKHTVAASAPGKLPWSVSVEVKADGAITPVTIPELPEAPTPAPTPPTAAPPPPVAPVAPARPDQGERPRSSSPLRIVGLVTAGAGVVSMAIGGVFGIVAKQKLDQSNQPGGCGGPSGNDCPGASYDARNAALGAGNAATAFFVIGGVLAAGGVAVWLLAPSPDAGRAASVQAMATAGPGFSGIALRGTWR